MYFAKKLPGIHTVQVQKALAALVTDKGQQLMTRLYLEGGFTMLKGRVPEVAA